MIRMSQITLTLPDKVAAELAEASKQVNCAPGDLAAELVQRGLAVRRFKVAREAVLGSLGQQSTVTDADAFKLLW